MFLMQAWETSSGGSQRRHRAGGSGGGGGGGSDSDGSAALTSHVNPVPPRKLPEAAKTCKSQAVARCAGKVRADALNRCRTRFKMYRIVLRVCSGNEGAPKDTRQGAARVPSWTQTWPPVSLPLCLARSRANHGACASTPSLL